MATKTLLSVDEYLATPTPFRSELVRGEIIKMGNPGARHGYICLNVAAILREWARRHRVGYVLANDSGVVTERDPDTVRGPDCQFLSRRRLPEGLPARGYPRVPPDLAVEVLSETDRRQDVLNKVDEFLAAGVLEVWVVDPQNETVQVFHGDSSPVTFAVGGELTSETVLPGFCCNVSDFFTDD